MIVIYYIVVDRCIVTTYYINWMNRVQPLRVHHGLKQTKQAKRFNMRAL